MTKEIEAVYEHGMIHPLQPLEPPEKHKNDNQAVRVLCLVLFVTLCGSQMKEATAASSSLVPIHYKENCRIVVGDCRVAPNIIDF